jgi:4-amino-4-deoxy-L-arabinose transferase-like glycosyltransferase
MKSLRNIINQTWEKLLVLCGALCVLLPTSPLNMPLAYRDSGVFLYIGWRILNGELPYRDVWDHKPPLIFYINALGLALTDNSRWGVWLIELAALFVAAYLGFQLIKRIFGIFPAVFSLVLWLLSLVPLLQGGNFTTEYTLPLQFTALWLAYDAERLKFSGWRFFLIGLTGAIAFFTKQTAVGMWIAIVIYLTLRKLSAGLIRQRLREISLIILGGVTVSMVMAGFFWAQGALPQFWSAAFEYNFVYASVTNSGLATRLDSILAGIKPLLRTGLFQVSMTGYIMAVLFLIFKKNTASKFAEILFIGLLNLPIELMLAGISRKTYPHYFMTMLPVLALFTGMAVWTVISLTSKWKIPVLLRYAAAAGVTGFFIWTSFYSYMDQIFIYRKFTKNEPVINYIKEVTAPQDYVLLWGAETSVNYFSQRRSPTRFVYQYALEREGYVNEELILEFLKDVIQNRPQLIINTNSSKPIYEFPIHTESMDEKITYLQSHYCLVQDIDSWTVYQYSETQCPP